MIRIFVSHSSKDLALTRAVYTELSTPDPACGPYEGAVTLDALADFARLPAGAPWPKHLHEWLAKSHAGLILLTQNALASDWVLKEATILTWRQSLSKDFRVFIALDKTIVTADALSESLWSALDFID